MIQLTDEERRRFAAYLLQEAASDDGIAEQMVLSGIGIEAVIQRLRQRAAMR